MPLSHLGLCATLPNPDFKLKVAAEGVQLSLRCGIAVVLLIAMPGVGLYGNFDIILGVFWAISHAFLRATPPYSCRVV